VKLGPGTLYGTLKRLAREGLIAEASQAPDPSDDDPRRRYYRLTAGGREALRQETTDLRRLLDVAVGKHVLESGA
jgi:DNA-binding PadR family transcriptional regulator